MKAIVKNIPIDTPLYPGADVRFTKYKAILIGTVIDVEKEYKNKSYAELGFIYRHINNNGGTWYFNKDWLQFIQTYTEKDYE
jgi:hypothetical protein